MTKYRKKPVVIEAIQFTGDEDNFSEVDKFMGGMCKWSPQTITNGIDTLFIETLEGTMRVDKGSFIIKGVQGEYYPCKEDIFKETYELAE